MSDERIERIRHDVETEYTEITDSIPIGDVRYLLDHIATLEAVRDAAGAMFKKLRESDKSENVDWPPLNEWNALVDAYDALAAAGQGETKNAPASE